MVNSKHLFESIREKTGFALPDEYLELYEAGRLRFGDNREHWVNHYEQIRLTRPPALGCCTHPLAVEWYAGEEMLKWKAPDHWKPRTVVAFADSGFNDQWCWFPEFTTSEGTSVVIVYDDTNDAEVYAANFEAFLYRCLLESFTYNESEVYSFCRGDPAILKRYLTLCIDCVAPHLSQSWTQTLRALVERPFRAFTPRDPQRVGLLGEEELQSLLKKDVLVSGIGKHFDYMVE